VCRSVWCYQLPPLHFKRLCCHLLCCRLQRASSSLHECSKYVRSTALLCIVLYCTTPYCTVLSHVVLYVHTCSLILIVTIQTDPKPCRVNGGLFAISVSHVTSCDSLLLLLSLTSPHTHTPFSPSIHTRPLFLRPLLSLTPFLFLTHLSPSSSSYLSLPHPDRRTRYILSLPDPQPQTPPSPLEVETTYKSDQCYGR
jgi:hypothetical protein